MNLADAMAPGGPFEPWYRGPSWANRRVVAKAIDGLPMSPAEAEFFASISGGRQPPRRRPRENWFAFGRGAGKDSVASGAAAIDAATFDPSILRPGERALVLCVATDKDTARIIRRYIGAFFERIPAFAEMVQRSTEDLIELSNSVDIAIAAGNFRSVRGRPILTAVLDEIAFFRSEESSTPDTELYRAILPGMRLPQSRMIGISSPYKKSGLLYKKHRDHFGQSSDDVVVLQAASHILNPVLDTRDRDRAMIEDPAAARSEWGAEFRDDLVTFIDPAVVDRAVVAGRTELPPVSGVTYIGGVDPSGGSSDSMTFSVAHAEGERGVLDYVGEWCAPFSPEAVVQEIADICRRYNIRTVIGDRYGGEWPRERFRVHGIEYEIAPMSRSDTYLHLLPALNTPGRIELLDQKRLISQLCGLERRVGRGKDSVDHPRGAHDDVINAAAISLCAAALALQSSADGWIEFYRRQVEEPWRFSGNTDTDPIKAPAFGLDFTTEQLIRIIVPAPIAADGFACGPYSGHRYGLRRVGSQAIVEMSHRDARELLAASPVWLALNPDAAKALGMTEVAE
jgi:hypothetical protein